MASFKIFVVLLVFYSTSTISNCQPIDDGIAKELKEEIQNLSVKVENIEERLMNHICDCDELGSTSIDCNRNGQCSCKQGYSGLKCDTCAEDYYGFPDCKPVFSDCNPLGSKSLIKDNGSCLCLGYVTGVQCDSCKSGKGNFPNCSLNGYPLKMKLSISGKAQKHQDSRGGTYFLQEDTRNNKPYWIHQSGGMAIWRDNDFDNWKVGRFDYLGSSSAGIKGPSNNDSPPNQISNGWQRAKDGYFHDTNDVHFEDWTFKQVLPPPSKLELTLAGKAKEVRSKYGREGTYILANGLVNGYPHWLKTSDGSQAIRFDKVGSSWLVGPKEKLGTKTGGIGGPNGKDSYPNEIKQGWRYAENGVSVDAGPNDVIFKAID